MLLALRKKAVVSELIVWDKREVIELKKFDPQIRIGYKGSLLAQLKTWLVFRDKMLKTQKKMEKWR